MVGRKWTAACTAEALGTAKAQKQGHPSSNQHTKHRMWVPLYHFPPRELRLLEDRTSSKGEREKFKTLRLLEHQGPYRTLVHRHYLQP